MAYDAWNCGFTGRLASNPETKTAGNTTVTKFRIARDKSFRDNNGNTQKRTVFHQMRYWGSRGEGIAKAFKTGDRVAVSNPEFYSDVVGEGNDRKYFTGFENGELFHMTAPPKNTNSSEDASGDEAPL